MTKTMKTLAVAGMTMGLAFHGQAGNGPSVQLGVVAQRYPWSETLDVGYKASGLAAAGTNAVVTVTASGETYSQVVTITNGQNTVAITAIPKDVKAKDAKVTLKLQ